jgi:hypothetical protein
MLMRSPCHLVHVCVCPVQFLNQFTNFHETWCEHYAEEEDTNTVVFNFLPSGTRT